MSRVFKGLSLIVKDRERLDRWFRFYIHHRNLYSKGIAEIAFVKNLVYLQPYLVWWLVIRESYPKFPVWAYVALVPVCIFVKTVFAWCLGRWWDTLKLYDRERDWDNNRNPIHKAVSEALLNGRGLDG